MKGTRCWALKMKAWDSEKTSGHNLNPTQGAKAKEKRNLGLWSQRQKGNERV